MNFKKIIDKWFLYEPLLFNVYCTHNLVENTEILCPMRTGMQRIEYNPELLKDYSEKDLEEILRNEIFRILLKHPYQRVPQNIQKAALKCSSDITIYENCDFSKFLTPASYYNLPENLCYEEYYKKLGYICTQENYPLQANGAQLWAEDEEMADKINQEISKAQRSNQWGSISGQIQENLLATLQIPMDYRRILSQFRASIISQRRKLTRMKPNRRYGFDFMGSMYEPKTHLLVAVDVSGSINSDDLKHFFSVINRFFSYGVENIKVLTFDSEIKQEFELKKAKKSFEITGRGGTCFQPVIDYYEGKNEYQGLIFFTDGYARIPKVKKNKQILWFFTSKNEYEVAKKWVKKIPANKATFIPSLG